MVSARAGSYHGGANAGIRRSAHFVRGLSSSGRAAAFVSSPTSGSDAPIKVAWGSGTNLVDTGESVACFYVANSSVPRSNRPDWPRVTAIGFELPGTPSGFSLVSPNSKDWELQESLSTCVAGQDVTLDFAIVARTQPATKPHGRPQRLVGIPPGQAEVRGSGTLFCVSGPFQQPTIEGTSTESSCSSAA